MANERFSRLIRRWVHRVRGSGETLPTRRTTNLVRLAVDEFESRLAPATLPAVVTTESRAIAGGGEPFFPTDNHHAGAGIAINPLNPLRMVSVSSNATGVLAQYSFDGGVNWQTLIDLRDTIFGPGPRRPDPTTSTEAVPQPFSNSSSPAVAMERDGYIYLVHLEHNAAKTSGAVVVNSWRWAPTDPDPIRVTDPASPDFSANNVIVYQWNGNDPALNPTIGVPNSAPSFTDPETGEVTLNPMVRSNNRAKAVYVAWNTNAAIPTNYPTSLGLNWNPNAIFVTSANDRGVNFSSPMAVSNTAKGYNVNPALPNNGGVAPVMAFSPSGDVTFAWTGLISADASGKLANITTDTSSPTGGDAAAEAVAAKLFLNTTAKGISDATIPATGPHIPGVTKSTISVTGAGLGATFKTLTDLDVPVAIQHHSLQQISVSLTSPTGTSVPLFFNKVAPDGSTPNPPTYLPPGENENLPIGLGDTANLGWLNGVSGFAVFDDQAPRRVNDPKNAAGSYIGHFRPEVGSLAVFNGLSAAQLTGTWTLTIVDNRVDPNPDLTVQALRGWGLRFTSIQSNNGFGDRNAFPPTEAPFALGLIQGIDDKSPVLNNASPVVGTGAAVSIAYDTSLSGATFGRNQGRLYAAYTSTDTTDASTYPNTHIEFVSSDDNGISWGLPFILNDDSKFDHKTEGNRPQMLPAVGVDDQTGAVSVMWYDARDDASGTRLSTYFATSQDGGATFGPQTFINAPKQARDTITNTPVTIEAFPSNLANAGDRGFGTHPLAFVASGGKITPVWIGSDNTTNSLLNSASLRVPSGPRVVGGDMGPVVDDVTFVNPATGTKFTYNNTFQADGSRVMDGFKVVFDRPVDPRTFDVTDVVVKYRAPGGTGFDPTPIGIDSVVPIDGKATANLNGVDVLVDATTFFVKFLTPQTKTGTYSYAVGPDVTDFARSTTGVRLVAPTGDYATPDFFTKVENKSIPDGAGKNKPGEYASTIDLPALPAGQVVGDVRVKVDIDHPQVSDLNIFLISPSGTKITLYTAESSAGGTGDNFVNTRFDAYSTNDIRIASAPYTGTFRPGGFVDPANYNNADQYRLTLPLDALAGETAAGTWTLLVQDESRPADNFKINKLTGVLKDWSLNITPGIANSTADPALGRAMDNDEDARPQQLTDAFAAPTSKTHVPFSQPYVGTSLPLILPGPNLRVDTATEDNVTVGSGQAASTDNLVLNAVAGTVDIKFDRDMDTTTFGKDDVVRIVGPTGNLYDSATTKVANAPFGISAVGKRTMRITFDPTVAAKFISGQYSIQLGSNIKSAAGELVDQNLNAGLFNLIGGDPNTQPLTLEDTASYSAVAGPLAGGKYSIPLYGTLSVPIDVPDDFIIRQNVGRSKFDPHVLLRLSISHPASPSLIGELVAPDGTRIRLFTGIGDPNGPPLPGFTGVFDDNATSPIQFLATEFPTEPFTPQLPLSPIVGKNAKGQWRLELTDTRTQPAPGNTTDPDGAGAVRTLNSWGLTFPFSNPVDNGNFQGTVAPPLNGAQQAFVNNQTSPTGLGETVADRITVGFRVFNQDPTNPQTRQVWVPVGPDGQNDKAFITDPNDPRFDPRFRTNNAGRVSAVAVDPADPSGNTVYVGAATGGIWKTTNFLTTSVEGPTWIPLTDFGPDNAVNIGSIVLYPRKTNPTDVQYNPELTAVFTLTGDSSRIDGGAAPVTSSNPGVGILRSLDGGRTWRVLDSTVNAFGGNVLPIDSPLRNHVFYGAEGNKIIVDPRPTTAGNVLLYMAVGGTGPAAGVWRSNNNGDSWTQIQVGNATDVALSLASAGSANGNANLEILFTAIQGQGVFFTPQATTVTLGGMQAIPGGQGNPLVRNVGFPPGTPGQEVAVNTPGGGPNGLRGRITLAVPALTDNPVRNSFYAGWLYAFVATPDGGFSGLYRTKDFGRNWTRIHIPAYLPNGDQISQTAFGTNFEANDATHALDYDLFRPRPLPNAFPDPTGLPRPSQANYDLALTVDPNNPDIIYVAGLGSTNGRPLPLGGSLRIDATLVTDAHSFVSFDESRALAGTAVETGTVGGVQPAKNDTAPAPFFPSVGLDSAVYKPTNAVDFYFDKTGRYEDFINLQRDPENPFLANNTIRVLNAQAFTNTGENAVVKPFTEILANANDVSRVVSFTDPLTGKTRLIYGTDHGVFTGVDDGTGSLINNVGFAPSVRYSRNGNMQISQFVSGAVQPSQLAADIAGAMFYGMSRDNGFPAAHRSVLQSGNLNWNNNLDGNGGRYDPTGVGVAVDAAGSGTAYEYRWPGLSGPGIGLPTDFFRVFGPNTDHTGVGVSRTNGLLQAGDNPGQNQGQWPLGDERPVGFFAVNPYDSRGLLIGSGAGRVFRSTNQGVNWSAVGEPVQLDGSIPRAVAFGAPVSAKSELNNFLYAGTENGNVFVTVTGQGPWTDISAGLDGSPVMQVLPNPTPNSKEVFVVTQKGVYHLANSANPGKGWVDLTSNLFSIRRTSFGEVSTAKTPTQASLLQSLTTLAVDWRTRLPQDPNDPTSPTFPPLYAGGDGGVFRTINGGTNWTIYPDVASDGAPVDGGYLPNTKVTDLDLSIGDFNNQYNPADPTSQLYKGANSLNLLVASTYGRGMFTIRLPANLSSGPKVVSVANPNVPVGGPSTSLLVRFDGAVDPNTFDPTDVTLLDPTGTKITVSAVQLATTPLPGQPDPRDLYRITFPTQAAAGNYYLKIGPDLSDIGGNLMNQDGILPNGKDPVDAYIQYVYLNGVASSLVISALPATITAGTTQQFKVTARDVNGLVIPNYNGTVTFTVTDVQGNVSPVTYTFSAADAGVHTFDVTLKTAGVQFVNVSKTAGPAINDGKGKTLVIAAPASKLTISTPFPSPVVAGDTKTFAVTAFDAFGNVASGYTGSVAVSSSDTGTGTVLTPANYTFKAADAGVHTFAGTLTTAGKQSITVTDAANGLSVTQSNIVVQPSAATALFVTGLPNPITAGDTKQYVVTAKDKYGNTATGFLGAVTITTTDPQSGGPTNYTFQATDGGTKTLDVQFKTAGNQTLTVAPAAGPITPGAAKTLVLAADAASFAVAGFPSPVVAGDAKPFTVTAFDPYGNLATGYAGTIRFTSTDPIAGLPADAKLSNGTGTFTATLKTAGAQDLVGTDTVNKGVTGAQKGIVVTPAVANGLFITDLASPVNAGDTPSFTVTAKDVFGNVATGFTGKAHFTSTDPQAVLPPDTAFTAGDAGVKQFSTTFKTAGPRSITVSAPGTSGVNPGSASTTVLPGPAAEFLVTPLPASLGAGEQASFTVTVKDAFGNLVTGFNGTVVFGSSDKQAVLPADHQFSAIDNGTRAFNVTFKTAGPQTLSVAAAGVAGSPVTLTTTVRPSLATRFEVSGGPPALVAGGTETITITARDQYGNIATGYAGTVRFSSTDKQAVLPGDSTLTAGQGSFTATLKTAGSQAVTATATSDSSLTGTVPVNVTAGAATQFELTGVTGPVTAGVPVNITVTAKDEFGNVAGGYGGTVVFTSSDGQATLPAATTLTDGVGRVAVTFQTAGTQTLVATDSADPGVTGSIAAVTVVLPPPPPNTAPTISAIGDRTVRLNQTTGAIGFTVGDDYTGTDLLGLTVTSSNGALVPLSNIILGGAGANRTITVNPAEGVSGDATLTITVRDAAGLTSSTAFTLTVTAQTGVQPPSLIGANQFAVGTDVGGAPSVRFFNPDATERFSLTAFDPGFSGGVRTAAADFNGDGIADIVVGAGPGIPTFVRVIDGKTQQELFNVTPFELSFTGGVNVAAGDLNGDGRAELVISPDLGGGPRVQVYNGSTFEKYVDFFGIDDPDFRGGARTAVGDVNGDKVGDLIVAAGFQGGPRVAGFNGKSLGTGVPVRVFADFFAFEDTLRNGVYVAAGDVDGDGYAEVIAGGGPGGGPRITAFSGKNLLGGGYVPVANFFGGDPDNRGGVRVAVKDLDGDDRADLVLGSGEGAGTRVTGYFGKNIAPSGTPSAAFDFDAFTRFNGGVFVG